MFNESWISKIRDWESFCEDFVTFILFCFLLCRKCQTSRQTRCNFPAETSWRHLQTRGRLTANCTLNGYLHLWNSMLGTRKSCRMCNAMLNATFIANLKLEFLNLATRGSSRSFLHVEVYFGHKHIKSLFIVQYTMYRYIIPHNKSTSIDDTV